MNTQFALAGSCLLLSAFAAAPTAPSNDWIIGSGQVVQYDTAGGPVHVNLLRIDAGGILQVTGSQPFKVFAQPDDGEEIELHAEHGRLAVDLPEDARQITLRWRSMSARIGAALGLVSVFACAWLWRREVPAGSRAAKGAGETQQARNHGA